MIGHHTVPSTPAGIKFMRLQAAAKFVNRHYTARFDAFQQSRVLGAISSVFLPVETTTGNTWEVIRSITAGVPGDPVHHQVRLQREDPRCREPDGDCSDTRADPALHGDDCRHRDQHHVRRH